MLKEGIFATCYFVLAYTVALYVVVDGDFCCLVVFCLLLFLNYLVVVVDVGFSRSRDIERDTHGLVVGSGWWWFW